MQTESANFIEQAIKEDLAAGNCPKKYTHGFRQNRMGIYILVMPNQFALILVLLTSLVALLICVLTIRIQPRKIQNM